MATDEIISGPMPLLPLIIGGCLLSVAVLLLTAGRRTLRATFGLAGLVIGLAAGWLISDALLPGLPPWIGGVLGGAAIGAMFLLLFRLAIALCLATVLMIAAPLALLTFGVVKTDQTESAEPAISQFEASGSSVYGVPEVIGGSSSGSRAGANGSRPEQISAPKSQRESDLDRDAEPSMADEVRDAAEALARERAQEAVRDAIDRELKKHPETQERIDAFAAWAGERRETLQDTWAGITPEGRNRLRAAMAAGFVLGLLLGFFLADLSTILASAGAGSALALIGIRLLTEPLGLEAVGRLLDNPAVTAACWTVLAMAGTGLQWTRRGQRADNGRRGA